MSKSFVNRNLKLKFGEESGKKDARRLKTMYPGFKRLEGKQDSGMLEKYDLLGMIQMQAYMIELQNYNLSEY